jgi:hypothetical protein
MDALAGALLAFLALLASPATVATPACERGRAPSYFVPHDGPIAIVGCVRLGVSGRPVELSASSERSGRADRLCVHPAYRGRGRLGIYIPAHCRMPAAADELRIVDTQVPRQAVRGYELVVWGTAPVATRRVVAYHPGGQATAAVLPVRRDLARRLGAPAAFSVFVAELPVGADGHPIDVRAWPRR